MEAEELDSKSIDDKKPNNMSLKAKLSHRKLMQQYIVNKAK